MRTAEEEKFLKNCDPYLEKGGEREVITALVVGWAICGQSDGWLFISTFLGTAFENTKNRPERELVQTDPLLLNTLWRAVLV